MKTDLIGKKFGRLTITDIPTRGRCVCECECGAIVSRTLYVLKTGNTKSCGCLHTDTRKANAQKLNAGNPDLTGKTFARLTVVARDGTNGRCVFWKCECECGEIRVVPTNSLTSGNTKSCGCLKRTRPNNKSPERSAWYRMRTRCNNRNSSDYSHYGGRGIVICEEWKSFAQFLADMGRRPSAKHSIERKDVNGPYSPDNCIWATQKTQTRNQRRTHWITFNGKTQSMADWSDELGISYTKLRRRLGLGWPVSEALTAP